MYPVLLFFEPFHIAGVVILGDVGAADLAYPQLQVAHVVGQKVVGVVHVALILEAWMSEKVEMLCRVVLHSTHMYWSRARKNCHAWAVFSARGGL